MNRSRTSILSLPLALVSLVVLSLKASADGVQVPCPNRPPDAYVVGPWVPSNVWDLETADTFDNCSTAPVRVPVVAPDTLGVTIRVGHDYAYQADGYVGAGAPPTVFRAGSWNVLPIAHGPNQIVGPATWLGWSGCPFTPAELVDAPVGGAPLGFSAVVWPIDQAPPSPSIPCGAFSSTVVVLGRHPVDAPKDPSVVGSLPAYQFRNPYSLELWKTTNGVGVIADGVARTREPRPFHELWITPATDVNPTWFPLNGGPANYTHSVAYAVGGLQRLRLAVWEIKAEEAAAHPELLVP